MSVTQIIGPAAEPVALDDVLRDLGYGDSGSLDADTIEVLSGRLTPLIIAARRSCEAYQRRAYITQTWLLQRDGFPGFNTRYQRDGYPAILLPKPPLQIVESFQYVDVAGIVQSLALDTSYGTSSLQYGYQLDNGGDVLPSRLFPPFARPWPPNRMVPNSVMIQFVSGYGGPVTLSMTAASALIAGATFLQSDIGRLLSVPGAGAEAGVLNTSIEAVDGSGHATAADDCVTAAAGVVAYLGNPVPAEILMAIRFLTQFYYEQGGSVDAPVPRIVADMLGECRNLTS
jgi:hypothetical protein